MRPLLDLTTIVDAYVVQFLDAVLAWVADGNAFHTSYIRSQVRQLLPTTVAGADAVDAIVRHLRNDPRLVYTENRIGHKFNLI
ncbi:hypothetical protein ACHHYP_20369 [Achlya hypogyna]|uniref:Uncharacterized protein n=1 Tax=Achlya hypogyna TaxID=1202772 RepID=A0A1V9YPG2_ACHHY|nr:hypothetical protein ACHHYP_20369 [Achlya hypogyna]